MFFSGAFLSSLLSLGAVTLATPVAQPRSEPGPWCDNLGIGAFDNAHNFTVAAHNTTSPNLDDKGVPLVLGQAGAISGAAFKVFSTYESFPYNDWPSLSLIDGGLIANGKYTPASGGNVLAGYSPSFITTSVNLPAPAQVWCAVASTSPNGGTTGYPILAVHGDADSFYLCKTGTSPNAQNNVVWKPSANTPGYIYDTCYPVKLQLIALD